MYEQYYGLTTKPFAIVPDPKFIYWAGPHRMASAMLEYGILNHAGFTVVTGEIGSGKTTLIRYLLGKLPNDIAVGFLSNVMADRGELLHWILMAFDQTFEDSSSYVVLYKQFEAFLRKQQSLGRRTVLIVDEAQNLGAKLLEELRLLSNVNTSESEYLQIVLSGQPDLKKILSAPELTQFVQRVSSDFHLGLLGRKDVAHYIRHRLAVAGAQRPLFTDDACDLVAYATEGTPRLVNTLCDTALVYGFAGSVPVISADLIEKVLEDKRQHGVFPIRPGLRFETLAENVNRIR